MDKKSKFTDIGTSSPVAAASSDSAGAANATALASIGEGSSAPAEADSTASPAHSSAAGAVSTDVADDRNATTPTGAIPEPIPGSEVLGRGIYVRPRQPYELKAFLFERGRNQTRLYRSNDTSLSYIVPEGCEVSESPPLPADQSLGETVIAESWDRFGKELTLNVNTAVSSKVLSIDATAFQATSLQSEEDSFYALRSSFIPFWNIYMPSTSPDEDTRKKLENLEKKVPDGPFNSLYRETYARIFEQYGSHYVKSAWVGGKASLVFVVAKSSQLSREDIRAGVQMTVAGIVTGGAATEQAQSQKKFRSNSSCKVFGSGGDPIALARLTKLDSEAYDNWLTSVKTNPEIIQIGVAGIWTLLENPEKSEALRQAYIQENSFTRLTAIVPVKNWLFFTKDVEAFDYDRFPKPGGPRMNVASYLFTRNTINNRSSLVAKLLKLSLRLDPEPDQDPDQVLVKRLNELILNGKSIYDHEKFSTRFQQLDKDEELREETRRLIHENKKSSSGGLAVIALNRLLLEDAFPEEIRRRSSPISLADYLPVLKKKEFANFIWPHSAFSLYGFSEDLQDQIYVFKWQQCLKIDTNTSNVLPSYPMSIQADWPGVDFSRIDATVAVAPNRVYFFSGSEYIRVDVLGGKPMGSTRDLIRNRWPGVIFDKIDTAIYWGNSKVYFFYSDQYIRYDMAIGRADPGYPRFLSSNYVEDWELFD